MALWHITFVTHNARVSRRMIEYRVKRGTAIFLDKESEVTVTKAIALIVSMDHIPVHAYAVCGDHVHMLLEAEDSRVAQIVGKLKSMSARAYSLRQGIIREVSAGSVSEQRGMPRCSLDKGRRGQTTHSLWARKFNRWCIRSDKHYQRTLQYIRYNRLKHDLPDHSELQVVINEMISASAAYSRQL